MDSEKSLGSDSEYVPESTSRGYLNHFTREKQGEADSRSLKYGTVFNTWLFAYSALGLVMAPEESLLEYKTIFVSTSRPEEMESVRASRKGCVQAMVSGMAFAGHRFRGFYMRPALRFDSRGMCGWPCVLIDKAWR